MRVRTCMAYNQLLSQDPEGQQQVALTLLPYELHLRILTNVGDDALRSLERNNN